MKTSALENPRTKLFRSPVAIIGAILAIGVIRMQDEKHMNESAIQASDRNIDPVKNEPHQQHRQSDGAGLLDTGHW